MQVVGTSKKSPALVSFLTVADVSFALVTRSVAVVFRGALLLSREHSVHLSAVVSARLNELVLSGEVPESTDRNTGQVRVSNVCSRVERFILVDRFNDVGFEF